MRRNPIPKFLTITSVRIFRTHLMFLHNFFLSSFIFDSERIFRKFMRAKKGREKEKEYTGKPKIFYALEAINSTV